MVLATKERGPRLRDHGKFWLCFAGLFVAALLIAFGVYVAFGMSAAAFVVLVEGTIALGLGVR